jgi:hypothetical protein
VETSRKSEGVLRGAPTMTDIERPDVKRVRQHLKWLVGAIVLAVITCLALTFYMYVRLSAGVHLAD